MNRLSRNLIAPSNFLFLCIQGFSEETMLNSRHSKSINENRMSLLKQRRWEDEWNIKLIDNTYVYRTLILYRIKVR